MSDPVAVSKYIYHKTKAANKSRKTHKATSGNNEINNVPFKEFTVPTLQETTAPIRSQSTKPVAKEIAIAPKKTETTDFFKRTNHNYSSRADEVILLSETRRAGEDKNMTVLSLQTETKKCEPLPVAEGEFPSYECNSHANISRF